MNEGIVVWVTGLAGSGKTTISSMVQKDLRQRGIESIILDGDLLREVTSEDLGYSWEDRLKDAFRKAKLCALLAEQGFNVICSTISLFHAVQNYNKANIKNYIEILIRVDIDILSKRKPEVYLDNKCNVWGIDLKPEWPLEPDLLLDGSKPFNENVETVVSEIISRIKEKSII